MIINIKGVVPRLPELRFQEPVNWKIETGQQWVVIGPNGAGKTLLADILQRRHAFQEGEVCTGFEGKMSESVKSIAFKDIYSLTDSRNTYYQQRWHSTEVGDVPVVADLLKEHVGTEELNGFLDLFNIGDLLSKRLIFLSSGELRKFLIVRVLLTRPRILILDNPFIGLDVASRDLLVEMLRQVIRLKDMQIVLLLSNPMDIPDMITHVLPVYNKKCMPSCTREQFFSDKETISLLFPIESTEVDAESNSLFPFADEVKESSGHHVTLSMEDVSIRYGARTVLKNLNWEVLNGEKWALSGPNGSGKSTLLSLVYADNPQSYANTFYLFDRKRGSGESIWDIKKRIGYVSPEMHLYYKENVPVLQIVGSGFFDSIGLHRRCSTEQELIALKWMKVFSIDHLKDRLFLSLSSGEQRLALLARAFVKDPDLLILDEPLHGLDVYNKKKVGRIIEEFCSRPGKTLIYVTHYPDELPGCVNKKYEVRRR